MPILSRPQFNFMFLFRFELGLPRSSQKHSKWLMWNNKGKKLQGSNPVKESSDTAACWRPMTLSPVSWTKWGQEKPVGDPKQPEGHLTWVFSRSWGAAWDHLHTDTTRPFAPPPPSHGQCPGATKTSAKSQPLLTSAILPSRLTWRGQLIQISTISFTGTHYTALADSTNNSPSKGSASK